MTPTPRFPTSRSPLNNCRPGFWQHYSRLCARYKILALVTQLTKENRDTIKNDIFILDFMEKLRKESPDKDLKNLSLGVLWEVLGKNMRHSKKEEQGK